MAAGFLRENLGVTETKEGLLCLWMVLSHPVQTSPFVCDSWESSQSCWTFTLAGLFLGVSGTCQSWLWGRGKLLQEMLYLDY